MLFCNLDPLPESPSRGPVTVGPAFFGCLPHWPGEVVNHFPTLRDEPKQTALGRLSLDVRVRALPLPRTYDLHANISFNRVACGGDGGAGREERTSAV